MTKHLLGILFLFFFFFDKRNNQVLSWGLKPSEHWWERQKRRPIRGEGQKEMTAILVPNAAGAKLDLFSLLLCFRFTFSPQFNCWCLEHNRKIFDNKKPLIWDEPVLAGSWQKPRNIFKIGPGRGQMYKKTMQKYIFQKGICHQEITSLDAAANVNYG